MKQAVQQISSQKWRQNINHLLDTVDKVSGYTDIKEILQTAAIKMVYLLDGEMTVVSAWDPDENRIIPEAFHTAGGWKLPSAWFAPKTPDQHPLFQKIRALGRSAQFNLGGMSLPLKAMELMETHGIQSWCAFPLLGPDKTILGVIDILDSRLPRTFRDDEISLGELLAKLTSVSYQRALLSRRGQIKSGQVAALKSLLDEVSEDAINYANEELLANLPEAFAESSDADFCLLSLYNAKTHCLELVRAYSRNGVELPGVYASSRQISDYPHIKECVRMKDLVRIDSTDPELSPEARSALTDIRARSALIIPLKHQGEVLGVAEMISTSQHFFVNREDYGVLQLLADQAIRAILHSGSQDILGQQAHFSRALVEAARTLNSSLNMSDVLLQIMKQTMAVMRSTTTNIMLIEDRGARVVEHRGYRQHPDLLEKLIGKTLPLSTGTIRTMLETHKPVIIPDTKNYPGWMDMYGNEWIRSYAGAPLIVEDEVIGFLNLDSDVPNTFTSSISTPLEAFASIAASVLHNAQKFKNVQDRASELEIVRKATLSLTSSLNLEELLNTILKQSLDLFTGQRNAHIFLYQDQTLKFGAAMREDGTEGEVWAEPREDGLTYTVARTGLPIIVDDMRQHPLFQNTPESWTGSIIGLPLKYGEMVVGVMNIGMETTYGFKEPQIRILKLLADQTAISIVNARLHNLVQQQSMTDMLTGLHNRRAFNLRLEEETRRSERYGHPFSLALLDLNGFKKVNDTYGHPAGDQVLIHISRCLGTSVRNTDFLARYGGDEFALIMPETPHGVAMEIGTRLQSSLEACDFGLESGPEFPITISVGIAEFPSHARALGSLIAAADDALYEAKRALKASA